MTLELDGTGTLELESGLDGHWKILDWPVLGGGDLTHGSGAWP